METNRHSQYNILITTGPGLYRDSLEKVISDIPGVKNTGVAGSYNELLEAVRDEQWDILLADVQEIDLVALFPHVKGSKFPKFIAFGLKDDTEGMQQLYHLGAKGLLTENSGIKDVKNAITSVMEGKPYYSEVLTGQIGHSNGGPYIELFSRRELEVLRLICGEYTTGEIAAILNRSEETIKRYRSILFQKTHAKNVVGLVKYAFRHRLYREP